MATNNTKKTLTIGGIIMTVIGTILAFGLNCMNAELEGKVDKELYRSEQTSLNKTVDKIDRRVLNIEREQIRQGRVQERIAVKLEVEIE